MRIKKKQGLQWAGSFAISSYSIKHKIVRLGQNAGENIPKGFLSQKKLLILMDVLYFRGNDSLLNIMESIES